MKSAYHNALLRHHPDKRPNPSKAVTTPLDYGLHAHPTLPTEHANKVDIGQIQDAYNTLSDPILKEQYDLIFSRHSRQDDSGKGPRPAQVISLEDFDELSGGGEDETIWAYSCRCGGSYRIGEQEMEKGVHLAGCGSCSEVVWVGYEVVEGEAEGDGVDGEEQHRGS